MNIQEHIHLRREKARRIIWDETKREAYEQSELPHYFFVIKTAGVIAFIKSEQAKIIPILGLVYSVTRSIFPNESAIVFKTPYPFVIGFFHVKEKTRCWQIFRAMTSYA